MENSIKPVEIDDGYADILKIKEQYAFRFGYTRPKEDLIAFKNRTIAAIASNIYDEFDLQFYTDRKSTRLNSSHRHTSRMPSSA